ncbi:MAG TPA: NADP-dependent glyceraldehyde-3-phosphate dehydrogenase [Candidatus Limiplasma sp.]|nr:NADP-dependent glyceraldehyde-3-phosphate dehydrogenase [Candidatus Limiplasma sp.]HPS80789.1 NADP-dependent glyceraldehyde-3-phosphate dehydrogenase [Candidatus Limiplasma sp.]
MFQNLCGKDKTYCNLYDGGWVKPSSGVYIDIISPVDGSLVGRVPAMNREDVDRAIANTKENLQSWAETPIYERARVLYHAADLLEANAEEIGHILTMEIAKDQKSAIFEVQRTAVFLRYTADAGKAIAGEAISGDNFPGGSKNKISYVSRVPLGTVLAISPFNYPINLSISKVAPALIGGNTVLLKPATQGSISALYLAAVMQAAGLPRGVLNTVTGYGSEIGDYVVTHPGVNFINFTGSTEVGKHISKLSAMVPLMLELGGKDAAIVLPDADLDFAADNIISGAYAYSGQRCTAVKRILTQDSVADQLAPKLLARIAKLQVGDPRENATIVPLINTHAADFVMSLIDDAVAKGATVLTGGTRSGNLIQPTLIDHVTTDMRLAWEEPFGPVLPMIRVKDMQDAIDIANRSEYGLQSSVFTKNIHDAFFVAGQLEVGSVQINNKTERGPDHFPFLGVKASGMGTQGVKYAIEAMTRPKAVVFNLDSNNR